MTTATVRFDLVRVSCYWRAVIPGAAGAFLLSLFWFAGVSSGYVMLFAMTLGTYSIIPGIYPWRDVSKRL